MAVVSETLMAGSSVYQLGVALSLTKSAIAAAVRLLSFRCIH